MLDSVSSASPGQNQDSLEGLHFLSDPGMPGCSPRRRCKRQLTEKSLKNWKCYPTICSWVNGGNGTFKPRSQCNVHVFGPWQCCFCLTLFTSCRSVSLLVGCLVIPVILLPFPISVPSMQGNPRGGFLQTVCRWLTRKWTKNGTEPIKDVTNLSLASIYSCDCSLIVTSMSFQWLFYATFLPGDKLNWQ